MAGRLHWPPGHIIVRVSVDILRRQVLVTDEAETFRIVAPIDAKMTRHLAGRTSAYFVAIQDGPNVAVLAYPDGTPREVSGW